MIIAFAGQKDGRGKKTTTIAVAAEWLARGRRVLLVDADPPGSTSTFASVAAEAGARGAYDDRHGPRVPPARSAPRLSGSYDITVIDCPPRHGEILRAALMVADVVVLPCGPSALDAWALGASVDLINEAKVFHPGLVAAVLITKKTARTAIGADARDVLAASGLPVLSTELFNRMHYQEAPAAGLGPSVYAPGSPAADEVRALATELEQLAATTIATEEISAGKPAISIRRPPPSAAVDAFVAGRPDAQAPGHLSVVGDRGTDERPDVQAPAPGCSRSRAVGRSGVRATGHPDARTAERPGDREPGHPDSRASSGSDVAPPRTPADLGARGPERSGVPTSSPSVSSSARAAGCVGG